MIFRCYICGEVICTCPEEDVYDEECIELEWMCGGCLWADGNFFSWESFFADMTEFIQFEEVIDPYEECN